jgi:predicted transcriptional regulator
MDHFFIIWRKAMKAKPLSELLKKVHPEIVKSARKKADRDVLEWRLAQLREQLEISQVELAKEMGISQPSVANLEKRGQEIKLSSLKKYVEAMGGKLVLDIELPNGQHVGMNC